MTSRPAEPLTAEDEAIFRRFIEETADGGHAARLLATLDHEREDRRRLRDPEVLGHAIHEVFCHGRAPMHSAPDHSAQRLLFFLDPDQ